MPCSHPLPMTSHLLASHHVHRSQGHEDGDARHRAPAELSSLPKSGFPPPMLQAKGGLAFILFCFGGHGWWVDPNSQRHLSCLLGVERGQQHVPTGTTGLSQHKPTITSHTMTRPPPQSLCTQPRARPACWAPRPVQVTCSDDPLSAGSAGPQGEQATLLQKHNALQRDDL